MVCCKEEVHVYDEEDSGVSVNQIEVKAKVQSPLKRCIFVLPMSSWNKDNDYLCLMGRCILL
jgi:hypothetical protein